MHPLPPPQPSLPRFTLFQIGSLHAHEPDVNIVIYDLGQLLSHTGLTVWFSSRMCSFPAGMDPLQRQIARSWRQVQVAQPQRAPHCFSHEHFTHQLLPAPLGPPLPPHVSNLRHYAWKPIIMRCSPRSSVAPASSPRALLQACSAKKRHLFLRGCGPGTILGNTHSCAPVVSVFEKPALMACLSGDSRGSGLRFAVDQGAALHYCFCVLFLCCVARDSRIPSALFFCF